MAAIAALLGISRAIRPAYAGKTALGYFSEPGIGVMLAAE
jgi:hypothetical protein